MVVPGAEWAQSSQDRCSDDGVRLYRTHMTHSHIFNYSHQIGTVGNSRDKCVQQSSGKRTEQTNKLLGSLDVPACLCDGAPHGVGPNVVNLETLFHRCWNSELYLLKKQKEQVSEKEGRGSEVVFGA